MKSPRGKRFWQFYEIPEGNTVLTDVWREREQQRPHPQESEERENIFKMCGYLLQFPFLYTTFCLWIFLFFYFWCEGGESSFCRSCLPSVLVKGELFGSSRFWWEGEILTLVADQGHSFSPLFFVYSLTGTWGPARVFSLRLRILKNGWFQTTKWTLCAVLRWEGVVLPGLRAKGDPLGKIHGYSGGTTIHPIDFTHGPHRASSLYV